MRRLLALVTMLLGVMGCRGGPAPSAPDAAVLADASSPSGAAPSPVVSAQPPPAVREYEEFRIRFPRPACRGQPATSDNPLEVQWHTTRKPSQKRKQHIQQGQRELHHEVTVMEVGVVTSIRRRGARLMLVQSTAWGTDRRCVAGLCDGHVLSLQRLLLVGDHAILLSAVSDPFPDDEAFRHLLSEMGMTIRDRVDDVVTGLGPGPCELPMGGLKHGFHGVVSLVPNDARPVGTVPGWGKVRMKGPWLFLQHSDGSASRYEYQDIMKLLEFGVDGDSFTCFREPGKREGMGPEGAQYTNTVDTRELKPWKQHRELGAFLVHRDPNHARARTLLDEHKQAWSKLKRGVDEGFLLFAQPELQAHDMKDSGFFARHPVAYWVDAFGQVVECENKSLRVPTFAEPLIYLYSATPMHARVELDPLIHVTESVPELVGCGFSVWIDDDGVLTASDGSSHRYLYWRGTSVLLPPPQEGFVVAVGEVPRFLTEVLARLGLNETESVDFVEYWSAQLRGHPYFLISFLPPELVDMVAPLHITPTPDVVLRVMMDFTGLDAPRELRPPHLPTAPVRRGFTVVEWGGILR
ncbi:MAG: hypothetical protein AB2A00_23580 [Myxococcota bacterium]